MRFLGAILIVVSCSTFGMLLAESLRKRVSTLNTLYCLLNDFSISIQYTAPTVWQLLEGAYNNSEFSDLRFLKTFHEEYTQGIPFNELWNASLSRDYSLQPTEREILYGLGNSLGKVGCDESVSNLHLAMDRLKTLHTQAVEAYAKNGNLYRWVGVLVGIAISIMVV